MVYPNRVKMKLVYRNLEYKMLNAMVANALNEPVDTNPGLPESNVVDSNPIENNDSLTISFSSELPALRSTKDGSAYYEVLDHNPASIDMSYAAKGVTFLKEHDVTKDVGWCSNIGFDSGQGSAMITFLFDPESQYLQKAMTKGLKPYVSFGYSLEGATYQRDGDIEGIPVIRVKNWMPAEISSVSIPVDMTVGATAVRSVQSEPDDIDLSHLLKNEQLEKTIKTEPEVGHKSKENLMENQELITEVRSIKTRLQTEIASLRSLVEEANRKEQAVQTIKEDLKQGQHVSFGKVVRSMVTGEKLNGLEAEVMTELNRANNTSSDFYYDPRLGHRAAGTVALNNVGVGDTLNRTNYETILPYLHEQSVIARCSTPLSVPAGHSSLEVPFQKTRPAVAGNPENGAAAFLTSLSFDKKTATAKTISGQIEVTRQMLDLGVAGVDAIVEAELLAALARQLDLSAFAKVGGTDLPSSLFEQRAVGNVVAQGVAGKLAYTDLLALDEAIFNANQDPTKFLYVTAPEVATKLATLDRKIGGPGVPHPPVFDRATGKIDFTELIRTSFMAKNLGVGGNRAGFIALNPADIWALSFGSIRLNRDMTSNAVSAKNLAVIDAHMYADVFLRRQSGVFTFEDLDTSVAW